MYKSLQVAYWQRVHNNYRLRTSNMFNYRLGSGSRFNCRYIGNGLKIITGYALAPCSITGSRSNCRLYIGSDALAACSPTTYKVLAPSWSSTKKAHGCFLPVFTPGGSPSWTTAPHYKPQTQGFHLAHPLLSVNAILQGLQKEPRRRRFLLQKVG